LHPADLLIPPRRAGGVPPVRVASLPRLAVLPLTLVNAEAIDPIRDEGGALRPRAPWLALALLVAGCRDKTVDPAPVPEPLPSASALSSASASPPSPPAPAAVPALPSRKVSSVTQPGGGILGEFSFERSAGDEGMAWLAAEDACVSQGKHLCTSTQWQAACEADPAIAAVETWTLTPEGKEGFVVRGGGGGGCGRKQVVSGSRASPFRAGACCTPALAAEGRNIQPAMLRAMAKNVQELERTLNQRRASALGGFFDERVRIFLSEKTREEAVGVFEHEFGKYADYAVVHELCDFSGEPAGETYTADCRKIARQGGKVGYLLTRYVFKAGVGKVRSITDPAMYRPFLEP